MRVALIPMLNLPGDHQHYSGLTAPYIPLGILSLVASLRKAGLPDVVVPDLNLEVDKHRIPLDEHFYDACAEILMASDADLYGFGTTCGDYIYALNLAKRIKARNSDAVVLFGGPHATIFAQETIRDFPSVDLVLAGEAEESLPTLVEALQTQSRLASCPGLSYRQSDGRIVTNPALSLVENLDDLPFPAYDLYREVLYESEDTIPLDVGRGCPFHCTFCSTSLFWKRTYRLKSEQRLLSEIRQLMEEYRVRRFQFPHDMFTLDKKRVTAFCNSLIEADLDIDWLCSARVDCVDDELLRTMRQAGCFRIHYGIETGAETLQKRIGKNLKLAEVRSTIDKTIEMGIRPKCTFMVGFPDETMDELRQTISLFTDLNAYFRTEAYLGLIACLPETPLYRQHEQKLQFDGFMTNDFVCNVLIDAGAQDLILKHRRMFSAYYHLETESIQRDLLKFVSVLRIVAFNYARSLTLIAKEMGPVDELYQSWQAWCREKGIEITLAWYLDQARVIKDFKDFVLSLIEEGQLNSPYLADVIDYEAAIFEYNEVVQEFDFQRRITRLREETARLAGRRVSESNRLEAPDPMAREFRYNMLELIDALQRGREHEIRKSPTLHLFHTKDHVGVHVMAYGTI